MPKPELEETRSIISMKIIADINLEYALKSANRPNSTAVSHINQLTVIVCLPEINLIICFRFMFR